MAHPKDNTEFEELVGNYYQHLYRFAWSLAKNEDQAADLTQQTFLTWAKKGHTLKDRSKAKSWLFTTLYREFLRQRKKKMPAQDLEPEIMENAPDESVIPVSRRVEAKEALAAIEQIEEVYRAPLSLFYIEDLSYKEIAEILDIPIGTVMSRLSRAKSQLKSILAESFSE